jgi:hypothetical protein
MADNTPISILPKILNPKNYNKILPAFEKLGVLQLVCTSFENWIIVVDGVVLHLIGKGELCMLNLLRWNLLNLCNVQKKDHYLSKVKMSKLPRIVLRMGTHERDLSHPGCHEYAVYNKISGAFP